MGSFRQAGPGFRVVACAALWLAACRPPTPKGTQGVIAPKTFSTLADLAPQIHSVVEGDVDDISFDDRDCEGPRTVVHVSRISALLGSAPQGDAITLRVFGGPRANGGWVRISEAPRYVLGGHYVLFLRNTDWRFSPVIGGYAFRRETIAGRDVLVDTDGHVVAGLGENGVQLGAQVTAPVGLSVKGAKRPPIAPPPAAGGSGSQCEPNSNRPCGPAPATVDAQRQHELQESGRFARPPVLEGVTAETVARAVTPVQLVEPLRRWAGANRLTFGGYFSPVSRLGCWNTTPLTRAVHNRRVLTREK